MSSPKFQVGDLVAVSNISSMDFIPSTEICNVTFFKAGDLVTQHVQNGKEQGRLRDDSYYYEVTNEVGSWYKQCCIRPISPDEYTEEQEEEELVV